MRQHLPAVLLQLVKDFKVVDNIELLSHTLLLA